MHTFGGGVTKNKITHADRLLPTERTRRSNTLDFLIIIVVVIIIHYNLQQLGIPRPVRPAPRDRSTRRAL